MEQEVLHLLQESPWFRERRNKDKGLALRLIKRYELQISESTLTQLLQDYASYDRYWRKHTKDYPALRGNDYDTKRKVVQRKQQEIGYEENFRGNVKTLEKLSTDEIPF